MRRILTTLVALAMLVVGARSASALPSWMQEGKSGRWMFNLKLGPAITAKNFESIPNHFTAGSIILEMGVAVDRKYNAYIILPVPQFQVDSNFGYFSWVMLPFGFQYDIPLLPHKIPGLYIYPRATIGYAALVPNGGGDTQNFGFVELAFGGKFIFAKRWNVGFEIFSLPIFFGQFCAGGNVANACTTETFVSYRLLWYGGVNF